MTTRPPLEPDEIITADGVRVLLRPPSAPPPGPRPGHASAPLLSFAAASVIVPLAAAGAACLVGMGMAAASVGLARQLLRPYGPAVHPRVDAWSGTSVTVLRLEFVLVEERF